jgi:endonuclease III
MPPTATCPYPTYEQAASSAQLHQHSVHALTPQHLRRRHYLLLAFGRHACEQREKRGRICCMLGQCWLGGERPVTTMHSSEKCEG